MFLILLLLVFCSVLDANKPAVILIPGAFHRASVYDVVKHQLGDAGYDQIDAVDLPSLGHEAKNVERTADVEVVTTLLSKRLKTGADVILVGNSYGATVATEAVKHFEAYSSTFPYPKPSPSGHILGLIMVQYFPPPPPCPPSNNPQALRLHPHHRRSDPHPPSPLHPPNRRPLLRLPPPQQQPHPPHSGDLGPRPRSLPARAHLLQPARRGRSGALVLAAPAYELQGAECDGDVFAYDGRFRVLYVVGRGDRCVTEEFARGRYLGQEGARFEVEVTGGDHVMVLSRPEEVCGGEGWGRGGGGGGGG